jgi:hypothetical protein
MGKVKYIISFSYSNTVWEDRPDIQAALYMLGFNNYDAQSIKHEIIELEVNSKIAQNIERTKTSIKEILHEKYYNVLDVNITHQLL